MRIYAAILAFVVAVLHVGIRGAKAQQEMPPSTSTTHESLNDRRNSGIVELTIGPTAPTFRDCLLTCSQFR